MKRLLFLTSVLVLLYSCAGNMPDWFSQREDYFPSEEYIVSEGWGATPDAAIKNAAVNMAYTFQTNISVEKNILKRYQSFSDNKNFSEYMSEFSEEVATLISDQNLVNILFVEPVKNRKTKSYFTLAYMQRSETGIILIDRIKRNQGNMEDYVRFAHIAADPVESYICYNAAWLISGHIRMLQEQLDVLLPGVSVPSIYSFSELNEKAEAAAKKIKFNISVEGDKDGRISQAIHKAVNEAGFSVTTDTGLMNIKSDVQIQAIDLHQESLVFVAWELHLNVLNAKGETILSNMEQGREGSINMQGAVLNAHKSMYTYLEQTLSSDITQYFDTKLK